jgi:acetoacetyl-CoA synthetase
MGTSEIYSALESIPEVHDSLIVDIPITSEQSYMPLFIVVKEGIPFSQELKSHINKTIRQMFS